MVIMHPRCSRRRFQRHCYVLVLKPLLGPEQEYLTLQPRQPLQPSREPGHDFTRLGMLVRIAAAILHSIIEWHHLSACGSAPEILQHVSADGQQPRAELTLSAKPTHSPKRPDERFLYHVIDFRVRRAHVR